MLIIERNVYLDFNFKMFEYYIGFYFRSKVPIKNLFCFNISFFSNRFDFYFLFNFIKAPFTE